MEPRDLHSAPPNDVRPDFDAVLYPHRSLGQTGFVVLMVAVSLVSFAAGLFFFLMGAWPVFGFFGLDVLLIYGAFKLNYRSAERSERVVLLGSRLFVEERSQKGVVSTTDFDAYWVRVALEPMPQERVRLVLRSHGESFVLGRFLNDDEKCAFAEALSEALFRFRSGVGSVAEP